MNSLKVYAPSYNFPSFSSLELNIKKDEEQYKKFEDIYKEFIDFNNDARYEKSENSLLTLYEILKRNVHSYLNNKLPVLNTTDFLSSSDGIKYYIKAANGPN